MKLLYEGRYKFYFINYVFIGRHKKLPKKCKKTAVDNLLYHQ